MSVSYKIHHLYKNKQGKKNERTNYCSNSLGQFLSGGHWKFKSKRWGLHKYKLVIGICIAEPLGPAGAAMPQEDQQLGHLGLRCQVRSKERLLQRRSVSPGEWQLETLASLVTSLWKSHRILGQAANQRSSYQSLCLQAKLYYIQPNEDK